MARSAARTVKPDYADITGDQKDVAVDQLLLDPENPRLSSFEVNGQDEILKALVEQQSVDEVAISIAKNGFYTTERLLVVPVSADSPDYSPEVTLYYVVEGNRRLAAVRILRDRELRDGLHVTGLPRLTRTRRAGLDFLPVAVFAAREPLWPYLGFRHVNGPRSWDAIDKAQFIARIHEEYGVPIEEITTRIGDRFATVRKMYLGYRLLRQAEEAHAFDRDDRFGARRFPFSHLYTAADQSPFQAFLGITDKRLKRPLPVPRSKMKDLQDLLLWIYGSRSRDIQPVVRSQSPDLNTLREIVRSADAVAALRSGRGLSAAHRVARGADVILRDALIAARENLQDASGLIVTGYQGEADLRSAAQDSVDLAEDIVSRMERYEPPAARPSRRRR